MIALLLALTIAASAQQATAPAGTLREAEINIVLEDSYASVVCNYVIERNGDSLVFRAERMPEQIVLIEGAFGPGFALQQVHQVEERLLLAPPGQTGTSLFRLRYNVEGDFSRLPLFIPNTMTAEDAALGITVVNAPEEALRGSSLPFRRLSESAHFATVDLLPESVFLPIGRSKPGFQTVFLLAALSLAAVTILYALASRIRRPAE
jgi:hypothetical protein